MSLWSQQLVAFAQRRWAAPWLWLPSIARSRHPRDQVGSRFPEPRARARHPRPRVAWLVLAVSWLLAGPLLASRFDLPTTGVALSVIQRFPRARHAMARAPRGHRDRRAAAAADLPLAAEHGDRGDARASRLARALFAAVARPRPHLTAVERYAENILGSLPQNAVLVVGEDYVYAGALYAQSALGERADVIVVASGLLQFPWYRARLVQRGLTIAARDAVRRLRRRARARRRSPGVRRPQAERRARRADRPRRSAPSSPSIHAARRRRRSTPYSRRNRAIFAAYRLDYARPADGDEYPAVIHRHYTAMWELIARALDAAGKPDDAQAARAIGADLCADP